MNQVKSLLCLGVEVAVVRGESGQAYVIDAFCPHLGANLAVGGTVYSRNKSEKISKCDKTQKELHYDSKTQENCIRCPLHGWSFRLEDGQCTNVPYEECKNTTNLIFSTFKI